MPPLLLPPLALVLVEDSDFSTSSLSSSSPSSLPEKAAGCLSCSGFGFRGWDGRSSLGYRAGTGTGAGGGGGVGGGGVGTSLIL